MLQIHSIQRSERLNYVLDYIFRERFGLEVQWIDTLEDYTGGFLLQYAPPTTPVKGFLMEAGNLLFEKGLKPVHDTEFLVFPFKNHTAAGAAYPDIFSAVFYHLSRHEEYYGGKDMHGRFDFRNSCLYTNKVLESPIIDEWLLRFKKDLMELLGIPADDFKTRDIFYTEAGIDIDSAFAYKGKNILRQAAAFARDFLKGNFYEFFKRAGVLFAGKKDPNDNFEIHAKCLGNRKAVYFVQVGPYGRYDKNVPPSVKPFRKIIQSLSEDGHQIALHPSYASADDKQSILNEKIILEKICGNKVYASRQHFLRFQLPLTYRVLQECGIQKEYSMGYSEVPGFRAGTAFPFKWYDLEKEKSSELCIVPFSVMDVSYKNFLKMDVEETIKASGIIKDKCKALNAPFIFVFHNESFSGHRGWENWEKVFTFWSHE